MRAVELVWTPSASVGVEIQRVKVFNTDSLEVYGEADLDPTATDFLASCPEGVTVQGSVNTIRGTQEAVALSNTLQVPLSPLEAATGLVLGIAPQV